MKPAKAVILNLAMIAQIGMAQQGSIPQPAPPPATPACTPAEVTQHVHVDSSKPLHRFLARVDKAIEKGTGGTLSGPTTDDVKKTLPPPCPVVPPPPAPQTTKR